MARPRTITISEINVSMHKPHAPWRYQRLLKKAYDLRLVIKRGRADGFLLGALYDKDAEQSRELRGELYRFTNVDVNAPWFNSATGKPAEETDTQRISIPQHLHPNLERIPFVFDLDKHRFWYVSRDRKATMAPSVAESVLQELFTAVVREHSMPLVEVTAVPDRSAVDEVLSVHRKTRLVMEFRRPNSDDASAWEQKIMEEMERRNVNRKHEVMTSSAEQGIVADEELKAQAAVAAHNGYVEVFGRDASGTSVRESTRSRPALHRMLVNPDLETVYDVLTRVSTGSKGR